MAAAAAAAGVGVALLPAFLLEKQISQGNLVRLFDVTLLTSSAYYIVLPDTGAKPVAVQFADWLDEHSTSVAIEHRHADRARTYCLVRVGVSVERVVQGEVRVLVGEVVREDRHIGAEQLRADPRREDGVRTDRFQLLVVRRARRVGLRRPAAAHPNT